ncbi:MAG: collagen-like protein [Thermoleophilia bacterium]|nr:collagen-like protein [Thermoleophilia bacterium]
MRISYAHIVSTLAIILGLSGTAYAASINGSMLPYDSVTGIKVKNGTLAEIDFNPMWFGYMRGPQGDSGLQGTQGIPGPIGITGVKGDHGDPSYAVSSWAYNDTGLLRNWSGTSPNNPALDWDSTCYQATTQPCAEPTNGGHTNIRPGGFDDIHMDGSHKAVVSLSGMNNGATYQLQQSGGTVTPTFSNNLSATANLTFMHRSNGESAVNNTGGDTLNGRLECKLSYGNGSALSSFNVMGTPEYATSYQQHEIVNITIVGNASYVQPGNYNVAASCIDADYTGLAQWSFVSGNLDVLAAQQ